jgi:pimeloyl-ACP methyl ester carboxylesterase
VLIHGAAADHNRWAPVLSALEERFTVFAIDRRGRGRSGDATDYALEREYHDVVAVVESAGEGVSVLGHSYGGICALEAADTIPREEQASREYVFDPARFRDLDVPTLYLLGGDSGEPFKAAGEALRGVLPDCRVAVMPGQRHAAMDTATDLFTAQVLSFLEAPDRAR